MKRAFAVAATGLLTAGAAEAQQTAPPRPAAVVPRGIQVEPKYFEPTSVDGEGGLGFSYSIHLALPGLGDSKPQVQETFSTVSLDFQARGNVALNQNINPSDFLKTGLDLAYVSSRVVRGELDPQCDLNDPDTVLKCMSLAMSGLRWEAAFTGSLESDQKFDRQAKAYGGKAMLAYVPRQSSLFNRLNVLDWPFRLLRAASGYEDTLRAEPHAFPRFLVALERVKPDRDPEREALLSSKEDYDRVNLEMAMSAPAAMLGKQKLTFDWSWRYFKELSPDEAVKTAKLDRFRYSALALRLDSGWSLTYATGRLPFDRQSDKVWEVGYQVLFPN